MKFTVTTPVPVPRDSFVVEIKTMHGDADAFRDFTMGPFKANEHEANMQSLLETLHRMKKRHPRGMCWSDNYRDVLGYAQWLSGGSSMDALHMWHKKIVAMHSEEVHQKLIDLSAGFGGSVWQCDPISGDESTEALWEYKAFYHDEEGAKYNVEIDLED